MDKAYKQLVAKYNRAYKEHNRAVKSPRNDWEEKYWQGQKDALRVALVLFAPDEQTADNYQALDDSSTGGLADLETVLLGIAREAHEVLDDMYGREPLPVDALNLLAWIEKSGVLNVANEREKEARHEQRV